jgi:hypothetical protein
MTISQTVLRDGETRVDHADPKAPVHGPPTICMVLLAPLTYDELNCLRSRLETASADYSVLRAAAEYGSEWYADLGALRAEMHDVADEVFRAAPAIIAADYARAVAAIGGSR